MNVWLMPSDTVSQRLSDLMAQLCATGYDWRHEDACGAETLLAASTGFGYYQSVLVRATGGGSAGAWPAADAG